MIGGQVTVAEYSCPLSAHSYVCLLIQLFKDDRYNLGKHVLNCGYVGMLQQYAKRGIPSGLRAQMWMGILQVDADERHQNYYSHLLQHVKSWDFLIDELFQMDVQQLVSLNNYRQDFTIV